MITIVDDATDDRFLQKVVANNRSLSLTVESVPVRRSAAGALDMEPALKTWRAAVARMEADRVMVLEDDQWFIAPFDLGAIEPIFHTENLRMLSLWDHGNALLRPPYARCVGPIAVFTPRFIETARSSRIAKWLILSEFSRSSLRRIAWAGSRRLGLIRRNQWLLNYQIFSVAGAIFDRKHWLSLHPVGQAGIDESIQVSRAVNLAIADSEGRFAYAIEPPVRTCFKTSAGGRTSSDFDLVAFNQILSDTWFAGDPSLLHDDGDLSDKRVIELLRVANISRCSPDDWIAWRREFADSYRAVGFSIGD